MQTWLALLSRPGWSQTHRSAHLCLPSTGIKYVHHHTLLCSVCFFKRGLILQPRPTRTCGNPRSNSSAEITRVSHQYPDCVRLKTFSWEEWHCAHFQNSPKLTPNPDAMRPMFQSDMNFKEVLGGQEVYSPVKATLQFRKTGSIVTTCWSGPEHFNLENIQNKKYKQKVPWAYFKYNQQRKFQNNIAVLILLLDRQVLVSSSSGWV